MPTEAMPTWLGTESTAMLMLAPLPLTVAEVDAEATAAAAAPLLPLLDPTSGAKSACGKPWLFSLGDTVCPVRRALPMSIGPKSYGIAEAPAQLHAADVSHLTASKNNFFNEMHSFLKLHSAQRHKDAQGLVKDHIALASFL